MMETRKQDNSIMLLVLTCLYALLHLKFLNLYPVVVLGSICFSFCYILFATRISVLYVFILCFPDLIFSGVSDNQHFITSQYYGVKVSVIFISTIAYTLRIIFSNRLSLRYRVFILLLIGLAIYSSLLGISNNPEFAGGFSLPLKIVLAISPLYYSGFLKVPIKNDLLNIARISCIFFLTGLMISHWKFFTISLACFLLFQNNFFDKALSLMVFLKILFIDVDLSFTMQIIPFTYFVIALLGSRIFIKRGLILSLIPLLVLPLFIGVTWMLSSLQLGVFTDVFFKIQEDRLLLWVYTIGLIITSNPLIVPSGRSIPTFNYLGSGDLNWEYGAHNIILELLRQNGFAVGLILSIFIILNIRKLIRKSHNQQKIWKHSIILIISFFISYGSLNNTLVYDNIGFLYMIILSSLNLKFEDENYPYLRSTSK